MRERRQKRRGGSARLNSMRPALAQRGRKEKSEVVAGLLMMKWRSEQVGEKRAGCDYALVVTSSWRTGGQKGDAKGKLSGRRRCLRLGR